MGALSREMQFSAYRLFIHHARHAFATIGLSDEIVYSAAELAQRHPLRGYDAVHLASALALNQALAAENAGSATFVSADSVLCDAAADEGLAVINPNLQV
jgi:predicted nucleic acid-binding protein